MNLTIDALRHELSKVLSTMPLSIDRVIDLSNEIAKADPDGVRFTTDAGIINRLGRELVAKQETAVAELIKNSYDADATNVELRFEDAVKPGGRLIIEDNGSGMTRDQLVNGFMRLSSADKIDNPVSGIFGRKRAGRKGIGRFAVQRLGMMLTIITQTKEDSQGLVVDIDWDSFTAGKELISVSNKIRREAKQRESGTTLIIDNLVEKWTDSEIRKAYRYILELLQPFPLRSEQKTKVDLPEKSKKIDPGFNVKISRTERGKTFSIADEQESIYKYAIAEIDAYIDSNGQPFCKVESDRLEINENIDLVQLVNAAPAIIGLRNTRMKAYYFIWQPDFYPKSVFSSLKALSQVRSGIRVYRNGFRVLPYGERKDDWLGLDASTASRDVLPPHANINFFGFVEITDDEGLFFDETSSREGLIENDAFHDLQSFCARALKTAVIRIAEIRGRKQTKTQKNWEEIKGNPNDVIRKAAERLKVVIEEKGNDVYDDFFEQANRYADDILEANKIVSDKEQQFLHELGMLRVLAALGLTIGEFTHEVRQTLDAAMLDAISLSNNLVNNPKLHRRALRLHSNVKRFTSYASYFDRAIRDNISRHLVTQNLKIAVTSFVELITPRMQEAQITVSSNFHGNKFTTVPMHASEISSILFNLYSNSQKAIKRANAVGKIKIDVIEAGKYLLLDFQDNGDGIPARNEAYIFDAFYTTSTDIVSDKDIDEEMQGSGLGLKIVRDIVEGYKGKVSVKKPEPNFSTCIRIEFPSELNVI